MRILAALLAVVVVAVAPAAATEAELWFPVRVGAGVELTDSFGAPRGDRTHQGVDIMAPQMTPVYAAAAGTIAAWRGDCAVGERCDSYYLLVDGEDGRSYLYVHLNNDTPGRPDGCDGVGGVDHAFAPRLVAALAERGTLVGVRVERGEHLGYVGSSGNAGCAVDHLHFEVRDGHGWSAPPIDPYPMLRAALDEGRAWGLAAATDRWAGADRVGTAVALSARTLDRAPTVVIAPAQRHAEALVAAPLAARFGAPVLLAWGDAEGRVTLDPAVTEELGRLGAEQAIIVGDHTALGPELETQLSDVGEVRRLAAADRYALSVTVAEELLADREGPTPVLLALGEHQVPDRSWPDALTASALAALEQVPVLLTRPEELPEPVADWLAAEADAGRVSEVRIVGGPAAVAPAVEEQLQRLGLTTRRLAGEDRYGTSVAVAEEFLTHPGTRAATVLLATGLDFPDALAAGPAAARVGAPLLLVHGQLIDASAATVTWLEQHAEVVTTVVAVGGPAAIAPTVLDAAAQRAG